MRPARRTAASAPIALVTDQTATAVGPVTLAEQRLHALEASDLVLARLLDVAGADPQGAARMAAL